MISGSCTLTSSADIAFCSRFQTTLWAFDECNALFPLAICGCVNIAQRYCVCDSGTGFDVEAALQGKGLGLTSMRERVRLVNGTIAIKSTPMAETTIHVLVPIDSERGPNDRLCSSIYLLEYPALG